MALEGSGSFATTHSVIDQLRSFNWTEEEATVLLKIALSNNQVRYILGDSDVSAFYGKILNSIKQDTNDAQKVRELMGT